MMTINDFVYKHDLKNNATSNTKIQQVLSSIGFDNIVFYVETDCFQQISEL